VLGLSYFVLGSTSVLDAPAVLGATGIVACGDVSLTMVVEITIEVQPVESLVAKPVNSSPVGIVAVAGGDVSAGVSDGVSVGVGVGVGVSVSSEVGVGVIGRTVTAPVELQ
jgi:hypothetical protein